MDKTIFERRHDDAASRADLYNFLIDAWDGTGGFQPPLDEWLDLSAYGSEVNLEGLPDWKGKSYIDRFPREGLEKYYSRVRRAHYANVVRTVGETICGFLTRRMPTRTTEDERLLAFEENADGLGSSWDDLLRIELSRRLWLLAAPILLVDRGAEAAQSAADQQPPYVTSIYPQALYDWQQDDAGDLLWVKFVQTHTTCGAADAERETFHVATEWTREGWRKWKMAPGQNPEPFGQGTHPCKRVPIVLGCMSHPVGTSILGTSEAFEIAQEARKLFNYQSLLDEHIYGQTYAVLAVVMPELAKQEGFKLGTDNALVLPAGGSASYIAPPASVADVLFRAINECIRRIYRAARLEFTMRESGQAESGTARQYEFSATNRALSGMAAEMARIERETKRLVLLWDGVADDAAEDILGADQVAWPDDFDVRDLERELKIALDTMILPIGDTAKAALLRTVRDDVVALTDDERKASDEEIEAEAKIGAMPPDGGEARIPGQPGEEMPTEGTEVAGTEGGAQVVDIASARTAPQAVQQATPGLEILTASSDKAAVVTVNEARAAMGISPLQLPGGQRDPDGDLTVEDFREKRKALRAAQETKMKGEAGPSVTADQADEGDEE